jgi:murein DD-endopeptidase MepM/ murein hydrolase activator NlpD
MNTRYTTATVFGVLTTLGVSAYAAVPATMIFPANGTGWYNSPGSPLHTATGGVGGADDTNALDLNKASDGDNNQPVYATADGSIERNISGWSGTSVGQLLLKHLNPDGSAYYCGYLHMKNITALKSQQGAYIKAGTQIGTISNVSPAQPLPNHLHFACYDWDGAKLRSKPVTLNQVTARPNIAITGNILINSAIVNRSPFPVSKLLPFTMSFSVQNYGAATVFGNYYLIMTRDQNGAQYVGKVGDLASCSYVAPSQQKSIRFSKPNFTSAPGIYWLQVYRDDCTYGGAALQRVGGVNPIAIQLK